MSSRIILVVRTCILCLIIFLMLWQMKYSLETVCENSETGKVKASQFPGFSLYWRGLEAKCNILEGQTDKAKEPATLLRPLGPRSAAAWPSRLGLLERRPGTPRLPDPARGQTTSPEETKICLPAIT